VLQATKQVEDPTMTLMGKSKVNQIVLVMYWNKGNY